MTILEDEGIFAKEFRQGISAMGESLVRFS